MKLSALISSERGKTITKCGNDKIVIRLNCLNEDTGLIDEVAYLQVGYTENAQKDKTYFVKARSLVDETEDFFINLPLWYTQKGENHGKTMWKGQEYKRIKQN